ncbi:hypothetical protein BS78_08G028200 [Paspalum vaginatum]|nr:hypothetical protein BS78_08G028200 [Paspalum vaginatum]
MAVPVARVHLAMAHAALPALLPTPPKWKMMAAQLTPPPCAALLPRSPPKKPGRADSDERWDARKMKPASPASSSSGKSGASSRDTCDTHKIGKTRRRPSPAAPTPWRALPAAHKSPLPPPPPPPHAKTSCIAAAADSSTGSNDDMEMDTAKSQLRRVLRAGPSFVAAPHPSMLPMPSFFIRVA